MHLLVRIIIESLFGWGLRRQPGIKPGWAFHPYLARKGTLVSIPVYTHRDQRSSAVVERRSIWTREWCLYTPCEGELPGQVFARHYYTPSCNNRNEYYRYHLVNSAPSITSESRITRRENDEMKRMIVDQSTRDHRHDPHETSFDASSHALNHSNTYIHTYIYITVKFEPHLRSCREVYL